jgi:hypothetical protein
MDALFEAAARSSTVKEITNLAASPRMRPCLSLPRGDQAAGVTDTT